MQEMSNNIRFLLNGQLITLGSEIDPTLSVLNYLREQQRLTGTKEGCAEGDCGACTVVVGEIVAGELKIQAVNACIQFVPTLNGKALFTVEYLRQQNGKLHPVQQALVDHHGSQCGFCTPGFVMSLWGLYVNHQTQQSRPNREQVCDALSGNLCRCTGYRPIIDAGSDMFSYDDVVFDGQAIVKQLTELHGDAPLCYQHDEVTFEAPKTLKQLTVLRSEKPDATLLAGSTDIGLWVNKQFRALGDIIYLGDVRELKRIDDDNDHLTIGAMVSLTDAYRAIYVHYPQIQQQWQRFASTPIRNAGTLGGNIANGSPIGDSMPWLIVLGAQVKLCNQARSRTLALEDLYLDYMQQDRQADEIVEAIIVPKPSTEQVFRTYKVSKRYDSDISAVCAAFCIYLDKQGKVSRCKIAFGGMAAMPKRALKAELALIGVDWNEDNAKIAMALLADDYSPMSDMRASANNRIETAQNLLYRFFLETRSDNSLSQQQLTVFA